MKNQIKLEKVKDLNLLCNYENGAVVFVDDENMTTVTQFLYDLDPCHLPHDMFVYLSESGFFTTDEDTFIQSYVHITDRCNMNCAGCYSRTSARNRVADMTIDQIRTVFDELQRHGVVRIVISGGEPMLRHDIVQVLDYAKKCGFEILMITNGSITIPDEVFSRLDVVSFSIDYLDQEYNSVNRKINKELLLANIQRARACGVPATGIITINSLNIDEVENYFKLSMEYQLPISFSIFYSEDSECQHLLIKDDQLRSFILKCKDGAEHLIEGFSAFDEIYCRNQCSVGRGSLSVDATGNLNPCHMMHKIVLGNLVSNPEEAWKNLHTFNEVVHISAECKSCDYKVLCGAGCKARSLMRKDLDTKDPYCEMYRSYYKEQYEYIKELIST